MRSVLGLIHFHRVLQSAHPFHQRTCLGSRRFAGQTLLEWMIGRVSDAQQLDQVGVLLPAHVDGDLVSRISPRVAVVPQVGAGSIADFAVAAEVCQADAVVLVGIERPFIDPVLIDELTLSAQSASADYAAFCFRPAIRTTATVKAPSSGSMSGSSPASTRADPIAVADPVGVAAEWCSTVGLRQAVENAGRALTDRQGWVQWLASQPDQFTVKQFHLPPALDRRDLRLAIENAEDWEHAHIIYEALGRDGLDWPRVTRLLDQHPDIRLRMARLNDAESGIAAPHIAREALVVT